MQSLKMVCFLLQFKNQFQSNSITSSFLFCQLFVYFWLWSWYADTMKALYWSWFCLRFLFTANRNEKSKYDIYLEKLRLSSKVLVLLWQCQICGFLAAEGWIQALNMCWFKAYFSKYFIGTFIWKIFHVNFFFSLAFSDY